MGRGRAGGGRCPSVAAAGGRGRGVPGEEQEKEVRGSGARLGPGEPLSARSWLALGSTGSKQLPFSRLPPSLPPSPLSPPPPLSALPGRGLPAGAGRNGTRDGKPPAGGGAAPRAAALRPDGARLGGAAGGSGGPQPPTPRRQLKMTGRENSSDIRGQPAPGRRFQGAASNPPPTPGPRKPLQRLRTRHPCSDPSTALFRLS
ncbi:uncharacterized protein LOC117195631 [Orcinus orca]|uniref:uncharacterized protein LOC117195631 n=1 Tax=Orcinus orca TaxID=9733 RepID=UPI002111029F|nr:uncharacterized protein LOC117195631 [Orcinus orca]